MNFTALHAFFAVLTGIFAIVLMILGAIDNDIYQRIVGFINAIMSSINTYFVVNKRDD